jgi:hypothetical protein
MLKAWCTTDAACSKQTMHFQSAGLWAQLAAMKAPCHAKPSSWPQQCTVQLVGTDSVVMSLELAEFVATVGACSTVLGLNPLPLLPELHVTRDKHTSVCRSHHSIRHTVQHSTATLHLIARCRLPSRKKVRPGRPLLRPGVYFQQCHSLSLSSSSPYSRSL